MGFVYNDRGYAKDRKKSFRIGGVMKKRLGFVSNSSSSSFIVGFDKKPENVDELQKMMFGEKEHITIYDYTALASSIADHVFNEIETNGLITAEELKEQILKDNKEWGDLCDLDAEKTYKEFKGKQIFVTEYCDNEGEFQTIMEHYGIFDNFTHERTSHH